MPYRAAVFSSLSVSCGSSSSLPPSRSMSSANRELHSGRPPRDADDSGCQFHLHLLLHQLAVDFCINLEMSSLSTSVVTVRCKIPKKVILECKVLLFCMTDTAPAMLKIVK